MYFKKLKEYENQIESEPVEERLAIKELDSWLISLSRNRADQINPLQFAIDKNIRWEIAASIFSNLAKVGLFRRFFRILTDGGEFIYESWGYPEEDADFYSFDQNRYLKLNECQIAIYYKLVDSPEREGIFQKDYNENFSAPPYSQRTVTESHNKELQDYYAAACE